MNVNIRKNTAGAKVAAAVRPAADAKTAAKKSKPKHVVKRDAIVTLLDKTLRTFEIADSSTNGLQVEGADHVSKIGLVVDASLEAYKRARDAGCQMIIAHHGLIWDGIKSVTGTVHKHLEFLIKNDINLYASHLPLDMHPTLGNNALIAKALGLKNLRPFGAYKNGLTLGFEGYLPRPATLKAMTELVAKKFGGPVLPLPFGPAKIWRVAVISGRGTAALPEAVEKKIDLFVTGEPSHENHHAALEGNVNVIYGGHYHTEKAGVIALGDFVNKRLGAAVEFLDVPTLV